MEGAEGATGAYVLEIPAGKHTNPQKHLYEDLIFVLKGRGATTIRNDQGAKQTFEWQDGSLFALPLNSSYQHFNGSGDEPARFFSVNSMPIVFNLFHNADFVFNTPRDFTDRFDGDPEYFSGKGKAYPGAYGTLISSPMRAISSSKNGKNAARLERTSCWSWLTARWRRTSRNFPSEPTRRPTVMARGSTSSLLKARASPCSGAKARSRNATTGRMAAFSPRRP